MKGSDVVVGRYLYTKVGGSCYQLLVGGGFRNTKVGHDRLIEEFNRRDRGKIEWKWEEVLSSDIDYPEAP